jgi:hypothetical protein
VSPPRSIGPGHRTPRALALAGLLLCGAAGCSPTATARVQNDSGGRLTDLRLVGERDSTRVRDLAPGEGVLVRARIRGEDALALRGRLDGRPLQPAMAAYVEAGAALELRVDAAGTVHVAPR